MDVRSASSLAAVLRQVKELRTRWGDGLAAMVLEAIYHQAEELARAVVKHESPQGRDWEARLDELLTSRLIGYPLMLLGLAVILWITVAGANYPSHLLGKALFTLGEVWRTVFRQWGISPWWQGLILDGVYRSLAWVVAVMLPPMAIFYPLFTILEDLGYLSRVAFNLDRFFARVGADGKQALCMAMGFGCNAVGVTAARIIPSPRERLVAVLTNSFVPCNGRFPTLIVLGMVFFGPSSPAVVAVVGGLVLVGVMIGLAVTWFFNRTILGEWPSFFVLELPPYRRPRFFRVLFRCVVDRIFFVLGRALLIAAPAGALIWLLAHHTYGGESILAFLTGRLDPLGRLLGLDGAILLAFFFGLPANELVLPTVLMNYLTAGAIIFPQTPAELHRVLLAHGWTVLTAVNTMVFSLLHFPCGTTLLAMAKETGTLRWPLFAAVFNTFLAAAVCFLLTQAVRIFH